MFCGKGWKRTKETYLLCWVQYERTEGSKQHADPRARDHIVTPIVITPASVSPVAGLIKTHSLLLNQLVRLSNSCVPQSFFKTEIDNKVLVILYIISTLKPNLCKNNNYPFFNTHFMFLWSCCFVINGLKYSHTVLGHLSFYIMI